MIRRKFIETLVKIADNDERVYLLTADMGFGLVEPFSTRFPKRFINVGVAEQNMIGIATGLSMTGKIVFVYSITNFPTLRCVEQIRNCVCYHNAKVHIVAGGTGFSYGAIGMSHHSTEDIAVMRALPNLTVISPSLEEVDSATKAIYNYKSPCYLRLGWVNMNDVQPNPRSITIGKADTVICGSDVCLISTGSMLSETVKASKELLEYGIRASVISMHTIKPIDVEAIANASKVSKMIVTIEEHSIIGGLGSAVAEVIARESIQVKLKCLGIPDEYCTKIGNRNEILEYYKLDVTNIVKEVRNAVN